MKLLFWSIIILGAMWLLGKKSLGAGNDLTAHLAEQKALNVIGDVALSANQSGNEMFPLATMGQAPFAGIQLDPFNSNSPFTSPFDPNFGQASPTYQPFF